MGEDWSEVQESVEGYAVQMKEAFLAYERKMKDAMQKEVIYKILNAMDEADVPTDNRFISCKCGSIVNSDDIKDHGKKCSHMRQWAEAIQSVGY